MCVAVMFAFEQCLLVLGHHPDIWYEAAQYLEQSSKLLAEKGVKKIYLKYVNIYFFRSDKLKKVFVNLFFLPTPLFPLSGHE